MKLFEQRAFVPSSLVNKTQAAIDALGWVKTSFGLLAGSPNLHFESHADFVYDFTVYPDDSPCAHQLQSTGSGYYRIDSLTNYGPNHWGQRYSGDGDNIVVADASFSASILGFPSVFATLADNTIIDQAVCEVTCSATFYNSYLTITPVQDVGGWHFEYDYHEDTEPVQLSYVVLAYMKGGGTQVVGSVAGTPNGKVETIDVTSLVQDMWSRKRDGSTLGFAVAVGFGVDAVTDPEDGYAFMETLRLPNACQFFFPTGATCPVTYQSPQNIHQLAWSNPALTNLRVKVQNSSDPDSGDVMQQRFPVLDD